MLLGLFPNNARRHASATCKVGGDREEVDGGATSTCGLKAGRVWLGVGRLVIGCQSIRWQRVRDPFSPATNKNYGNFPTVVYATTLSHLEREQIIDRLLYVVYCLVLYAC